MGRELSNQDRNRIIDAYFKGCELQQIADILGCHRTTVNKVIQVYLKEGRIEKKQRGGTRRKSLNDFNKALLKSYMIEDCGISLRKMKGKLEAETNVIASLKTIDRAINSFNWSLKRSSLIPERRNDHATIEKRFEYASKLFDLISLHDGQNFYFIDEVGFSLTMRTKRGRSPRGYRAVHNVSNLRSRNISICSAISKNSPFYYEMLNVPFNAQRFTIFIENILSRLNQHGIKNAVLIMDNVPFHKNMKVKNIIEAAGHNILLLPPYSPFLNPIENMFSQWKEMVRRSRPVNEKELLQNIDDAFSCISNEHCANYYRDMLSFLPLCLKREEVINE
jgi:transposase